MKGPPGNTPFYTCKHIHTLFWIYPKITFGNFNAGRKLLHFLFATLDMNNTALSGRYGSQHYSHLNDGTNYCHLNQVPKRRVLLAPEILFSKQNLMCLRHYRTGNYSISLILNHHNLDFYLDIGR